MLSALCSLLPKGVMKILITGANGQLGHDFIGILGADNDLFPFDLDLDITDFSAVRAKIRDIKPEIIINSAAYTDVDGCETNVEIAYRVNAIGPQNLALAAKAVGAALVTFSTDFVFDGTKTTLYDEFDRPNPMSVYGRSKLAGEEMARTIHPELYIIRTAWLYGKHGHNFVKTMLRLADERDVLTVVDDQVGSPTYSADLANRVVEIMNTGFYGTYHVTNSGTASWFEFARAILEAAGQDPARVRPMKSKDLNRPATRPAYSALRNYMTELRQMPPMRSFKEALGDYFS